MAIKCTAEVTIVDETDIDHLTTWYYRSTSPTKPSAPQDGTSPASPWTTTEPGYDSSLGTTYLYTVMQTVWGDGSLTYGAVQISSSYEAAKQAANATAALAQTVTSEFERTDEAIALRVTKQEFEALEIGGRNLLRKTGSFELSNWGFSSSSPVTCPEPGVLLIGENCWPKYKVDYLSYADHKNEVYTFSIDVKVADGESATESQLLMYIGVNVASRLANSLSSSYDRYSSEAVTVTNEWKRYSVTLRVPDDLTAGQTSALVDSSFLTVEPAVRSNYTPVMVRLPKLEKGNRATDWTPAPEDIETRMTSAETAIEQTANNVLIKATENDTTATQGGQHLIQSLINVAPSGVTIDADKVNIAGAAIFNSYSTTTEMNAAISDAVDGIEVGGRNLAIGTKSMSAWIGNSAYWAVSDGIATFTPPSSLSWYSFEALPSLPIDELTFNVKHVFSIDIRLVSGSFASGDSISLNIDLHDTPTTATRKGYRGASIDLSKVTSEWTRVYVTISAAQRSSWNGQTGTENWFSAGVWAYTSTATFQVRHAKLEQGTKPTPWSPALEDSDSKPSLSPFFQTSLSDCTADDSGPMDGHYWVGPVTSTQYVPYFGTNLENGWAHISIDGTNANNYIRMAATDAIVDGKTYTMLVEFRNITSMPTSASIYVQQGSYIQVWGGASYDGWSINNVDLGNKNSSYQSYYFVVIPRGVSEHSTNPLRLMHLNWQCPSGSIECDIRLSIYEGWYAGEWQPFVDPTISRGLIASTRSWYATCSTAAATVAKEAATTDDGFVLREGVAVDVKFANTNTGAVGSLTLNVNGTGAKSIKTVRTNAISNLGDAKFLYSGSIIRFTYNGTYWLATENYNSNNLDRTQHNNAIKAASANATGKEYAVVTTTLIGYVASLSGYQTILPGTVVDITKPLLWSTGNVAAGATFTNAYEVYPSQSLRNQYSSWSGTTYNMAYLFGTLSGSSLTVGSTVFTDTLPSSENGMVYIPVGILYSAYQISFRTSSELWAYLDGKFRQVNASTVVATQKVYYRCSVSTATPSTAITKPSAWVTETGDKRAANLTTAANWSLKKSSIAASTSEGETKYLYLYMCEQQRRLDGTLSYTTVALDDTTTVIDGGNVITNSITATQIAANTITADELNVSNINASNSLTIGAFQQSTQDAISNDEIEVGGRNLVVASTTTDGYLAGSGTIGGMDSTRKEGYSDYIPVSPGESLVFQAWVTVAASNTEYLWMAYEFYNSSKTYVGTRPSKIGGTVLADGRTYNLFDEIIVPSNAAYIRVSMRRYDDGVMKLERGNKPTDWTEAPEDTSQRIGNVDDAVSETSDRLDEAVATLNGLSKDAETQAQWLHFNEESGLVIGASDPDTKELEPFRTAYTNADIQFQYVESNETTVMASLSGDGFEAPSMTANEIHLGNWMWVNRENGNLSLKYIG